MIRALTLACLVAFLGHPAWVAADNQPAPAQFALVVGSNAGGPGQATLRYAQDDAKRVGSFLTELGGYAPGSVDVLLAPSPDEVRQHLDTLAARVRTEVTAGRKARVMFYYSGHARATALDLGSSQLPLAELRTRLFTVPAQLTVVVLDACQSGAFSRVKGAAPAADFSFNSKSQLGATGVAVLASSSGSELSQESETLQSSYFTHHLLVGMRGAADTDRDGQVSIDEAYRYAYNQTLLATAETAVGGQHVTFEVDLKGHGQVPMSFPRRATSSITLPAALEGKTLVEDVRARAVIAETFKAKGAPVRIAVAPGEYNVLVRNGSLLSRCKVTASATGAEVDLTQCRTEKVVAAVTKGYGEEPRDRAVIERGWTYGKRTRLEVGVLVGSDHEDGYTDTLETFGYAKDAKGGNGLAISALRRINRNLWVGGTATYTGGPSYLRQDELSSLAIAWTGGSIGGLAEGLLPFSRTGRYAGVALFANVGLGLAIARTSFTDNTGEMSDLTHTWYFGPALSAGGGLRIESKLVPGLGMAMGYQYLYHHAIDNLAGDTHDGGGSRITLGAFLTF